MSKGFGIAALVIAILGIFVPVVSLYVVWLALILGTIAATNGDEAFSVATFVICLVNVIFLSPLTLLLLSTANKQGESNLMIFTIAFFLGPLIGLIFASKTKHSTKM